ncbi:MAG: hypothetical protein IT440_16440 [Phycisphaeraceae bacterium]|jgi:hypothetical protein|nr:hypothetical protein [Phycisphaeraceae bacterium]
MNTNVSIKRIIFLSLIIGVIVLGAYVWVIKNNPPTVPTALETQLGINKKEKGTQLYYSEALGVGFTYKSFSDDYVPKITESGNKIYVGEYQSIEVFEKDQNVTLEQAIKDSILKGVSDAECFVKIYEMGEGDVKDYISAGISYHGEKGSTEPLFTQKHICPTQYAETNGVRYFLMNKNVPTKFLFVDIGQDSMMSDGNPTAEGFLKGWYNSLRIVE